MTNFFAGDKSLGRPKFKADKNSGPFVKLILNGILKGIFLSTCVHKFTVFIWVKFESGKENKKKFFL